MNGLSALIMTMALLGTTFTQEVKPDPKLAPGIGFGDIYFKAPPQPNDLLEPPADLADKMKRQLEANDFKGFVESQNSFGNRMWQAKLAQEIDYTKLDSLIGAQLDEKDANIVNLDQSPPPNTGRLLQALPGTYDQRTAFPSCWSIKYIRNQARCGSCWAVAGATALSDRACRYNTPIWFLSWIHFKSHSFSYQDALECCPAFVCTPNPSWNGCNGGYITGPYRMARDEGLVTGENFGNTTLTNCKNYFLSPAAPFTLAPACRRYCTTPGTPIPYYADKRHIASYTVYTGTPTSVANAMANAIHKRGTVTAYMQVFTDFFTYSAGVYKKSPIAAYRGGHAVRVIGWGVDITITWPFNVILGPYWICANSWGTSWGLAGFFRIRRGTNEVGIESYFVEGNFY